MHVREPCRGRTVRRLRDCTAAGGGVGCHWQQCEEAAQEEPAKSPSLARVRAVGGRGASEATHPAGAGADAAEEAAGAPSHCHADGPLHGTQGTYVRAPEGSHWLVESTGGQADPLGCYRRTEKPWLRRTIPDTWGQGRDCPGGGREGRTAAGERTSGEAATEGTHETTTETAAVAGEEATAAGDQAAEGKKATARGGGEGKQATAGGGEAEEEEGCQSALPHRPHHAPNCSPAVVAILLSFACPCRSPRASVSRLPFRSGPRAGGGGARLGSAAAGHRRVSGSAVAARGSAEPSPSPLLRPRLRLTRQSHQWVSRRRPIFSRRPVALRWRRQLLRQLPVAWGPGPEAPWLRQVHAAGLR
mmetsp:Transcript_14416/g.56689  ORF Transcript_14416/g.56689 Transcript_14416/m.56689 type:complete len:360 (+) Transcript_14416:1195-2274(+)